MKKTLLLSLCGIISLGLNAQQGDIKSQTYNDAPTFGPVEETRAAGDSCGFYYNQYVPLNKTSTVYFEPMRTGNGTDQGEYAGRAQRFTATQDVQIMGVQFYAFETNPLLDSIMAITAIHEYIPGSDEVGPEIIRDTVWVKHQAYTPVLPDVEVNSIFDSTITVSTDYIVAISTPTDDSLKVYTSDRFSNDGAGEGVSFALYENPIAFPGFYQWYNVLTTFGSSFDYDYLINPLVKYDLHDDFTILDDSICPNVAGAGQVNYVQVPHFTNPHYNGDAGAPTTNIQWYWGDGFGIADVTSANHGYSTPGTYDITLQDTLVVHNFNNPYCVINISMPIVVQDSVTADFTHIASNLTVDFTNTSVNADSVWWDFGDGNTGTGDNPQHVYGSVATFDVWLYAENECFIDSVMMQVSTDDVGIEDPNQKFSFYPIPADNQLIVEGLDNGNTIEMFNIVGERIYQTTVTANKETIDVSTLPAGTYLIKITSDNQGQFTRKVFVHH